MNHERLRILLELSRRGSMTQVAADRLTSTSTISQQLAVLAREAGATLLEPDGRGVRLTWAGRRLAEHAERILAAVDAARLDLRPDAEPEGTVRVAGHATGIRRWLLPQVRRLERDHPGVRLSLREHEPAESLELLAADAVDLALVYDFDLAPLALPEAYPVLRLARSPWSFAVPSAVAAAPPLDTARGTSAVFRALCAHGWITNSRNRADEEVLRLLGSLSGTAPRVQHLVDSLDLVEEMVAGGLGVGLLPADRPVGPEVTLVGLDDPPLHDRGYVVTRPALAGWPPVTVLLSCLRDPH